MKRNINKSNDAYISNDSSYSEIDGGQSTESSKFSEDKDGKKKKPKDVSEPAEVKGFMERKKEYEVHNIKRARKEHFSLSGMEFKQKHRKRLQSKPVWMNMLAEANINYKEIIDSIDTDDIVEFFTNEEIVFRLTEEEMSQLKTLLKDQMVLETDLKMGAIKGSEDIYTLVAKLARCNGDISDMPAKDQVAIMSLVQFNNITPAFGDDYNEHAIEICIENGAEFVEFTDIMGSEIYVRKSSFVKAQILENKIVDELKKYERNISHRSSFMVFCGVLYFSLKLFLFIMAWLYSGASLGYKHALAKINDYSAKEGENI